ncbi:hypothetical protein BO70DRAFT_424909 [Aspergillus heteromorphus CBS 117.55]|uniref:Arylsulfotransferase n=1 Tax=Aspergillus heteromorphus CBS 117.55 TaxID=1448321 RepID=A0A317X0J7_9EURO|nr:uncharacterized protein BO70DRAFT_424909 [Aspergillus heteromorphus CBS 117.55]PWY92164.1 hypothetical protein BO70DRAFT_424909 [Aspergillus heteromorphus CBS 117.55]
MMLVSPLVALATLLTPVWADMGPYFHNGMYEAGKLGAWPMETYRSSSAVGAAINFVAYNPECQDGQYYFIAPRGKSVHKPGPMILDHDGHLIWTKHYGQTYNTNLYRYKGQDYITFWVGNDGIVGHGHGVYYMLDSSYKEAYKVQAANGLKGDIHEFHITLDETAVFTIFDLRQADLRAAGGPKDGWVWDGTFQEIDIETGECLFQWHASEHFDIGDVVRGREGAGGDKDNAWDFFHINSVDKDAKGNFLVSSRHASCLVYIDGRTGEVLWRLGGKNNSFTDLSENTSKGATDISWQHHARFHNNGTVITLFDNASRGVGAPSYVSRGLYLDIDQEHMTVKIRHEYWNPHHLKSQSQGSLQILDSGNILVGYGFNAAWTEYTIDGDVVCDIHFGPAREFGRGNIESYRVFKHPWVGFPKTWPTFEVFSYGTAASWNGATEVRTWVLQGTNNPNPKPHSINEVENEEFTTLFTTPKSGFETLLPIPRNATFSHLRALALNGTGHVLGTTKLAIWDPDSDSALIIGGDNLPADRDDGDDDSDGSGRLHSLISSIVSFSGAVFLAGHLRAGSTLEGSLGYGERGRLDSTSAER